MIHFAVVVGRPETVGRLALELPAVLDRTAVAIGDLRHESATTGSWTVAALDFDDALCGARVVADGDSLAVVNGPALAQEGGQRDLAAAALHRYRSGGPAAVARALGGTYNFVGIDPDRGTRAFADFSGLCPLYWAQGDDFAVLSNRSTTVREIVGAHGWDARALSWIIGHSNLFGDDLPARSVRYIRPGTEASVDWCASNVSVVRSETWVWPDPADDTARDDLTSNEWDEITDQLIANCRTFGSFHRGGILNLSGGKDSRLCLALAKAAGMEEQVIAYTSGPPQSAEVACAREVARIAAFAHRVGDGPVEWPSRRSPELPTGAPEPRPDTPAGRPPGPDRARLIGPGGDTSWRDNPPAVWRLLRQAAYRYESIVCPWDGLTPPLTSRFLSIKGFGGELYRGPGGHAKRFGKRLPTSADEMAAMFVDYHQRIDPLGVLVPEVRAAQVAWLENWVHESSEQVRLDLLPEKFFVDNRLGHWNGPLLHGKPTHVIVNPLLSQGVALRFFTLSPHARSTERLHYEVMRRAAPELVLVPFAGDRWSDAVLESSDMDLPREPFPPPAPAVPRPYAGPPEVASAIAGPAKAGSVTASRPKGNRRAKTWQWPFLEGQAREIAELFVRAERESDMAEICDLAGLRAAAASAEDITVNVQGKALVGAVSVALTLLGESEPFRDGQS